MERDYRKIGELMYTYDEVLKASIKYFGGDELDDSVFA